MGSKALQPPAPDTDPQLTTVEEQRTYLYRILREQLGLDETAVAKVRKIVDASDWLSFGNPKASKHPMSRSECRQRRAAGKTFDPDPRCGAPNMVTVYDPQATDGPHSPESARLCIDQYEFPDIPCEYPVVWVRSSEAAELCAAVGKRLCDAHEWEGACAGRLLPVEKEYPWSELPPVYEDKSLRTKRRIQLEYRHNEARDIVWAYGPEKDHSKCATGARKDPRCTVVDWGTCGTQSFPAGSFLECVSPFGVYDQHGNAAEHMNLPIYPDELASEGHLGWTEMKGSWFLFQREETHPDDCRWRAKNWHTTRIDHWNSHRNYHLGFRCCKDIEPAP